MPLKYTNKTQQVAGDDIGNSADKIKSRYEEVAMPSSLLPSYVTSGRVDRAIGQTHELQFDGDENAKFIWSDNIGQFKKDEYIEYSRMKSDRYTSDPFARQVAATLAKIVSNEKFKKTDVTGAGAKGSPDVYLIDYLTVGVPTNDLNDKTKAELETVFLGAPVPKDPFDLKSFDSKIHTVIFDGETYRIKVGKLFVKAQPEGTVFDYVMNDRGVIDQEKAELTYGVLDIGSGTWIFDEIGQLQAVPRSNTTEFHGVATLINDILDSASEKGYNDLTFNGIEQMLRQSKDGQYIYIYSARNKIDLTDIVNRNRKRYTQTIVTALRSKYGSFKNFDVILITGGGVNVIDQDMIKKALSTIDPNSSTAQVGDDIEFVDDPQMSNVRGFYKLSYNAMEIYKKLGKKS